MEKKLLERFYNVGYGDYICSGCQHKYLSGRYMAVGEVGDEEGYNWRGFCKECEEYVKNMSDEKIFNTYNSSSLV